MRKFADLETPAAVAQADALAAKLIERAKPIRFAVAQSPEDLQAVYRLRCRIVIERQWAKSEDVPDGLERDAYDARAVHVAAWDGNVLAGTSRLVLPLPGHPLPTEDAIGLEIVPRGGVADVGRICVAPGYRHASHRVLWGLLGRTWIEMRRRCLAYACCILSPAAARMYQSWGLQVIKLGPPRPYCGEERYPALVRPAESVQTFIRRTTRLHVELPSASFAAAVPLPNPRI